MRYASVLIRSDGTLQFDRLFASFSEAVDWANDGGANDGLIVSEPVARMLDGRKTTCHDTPNFQHLNLDGEAVWYRDPEEHAAMVFAAVTGIEIGAKEVAAAKDPAGVYVQGVQVFAERAAEGVILAAYNDPRDAAVRVRALPWLYRVEWWDGGNLLSAPPHALPDQDFFRRYLGADQHPRRD